ncbi:leukocyte tyrosine kinase receptor isoform X2 [Sceloporus undulatus]|uniref:leukocyte tyrosine kinase receptor isoform X2 n=1 Tax=Sceloporus undulatus TaxID=8520 RepID=UPI001C4ADBDA|nr:leukocyte tyrosine kinase receptor isoform X2 [Sceloporus undulatus]
MDFFRHLALSFQLVLWTTTSVAFSTRSDEKASAFLYAPPRLSPSKNRMISSDQSSHSETPCNLGWNCSWVTSTNAAGKPDWLLSSVVALMSQEDQQIMENSSSNRDLEGDILLLNTSKLTGRCMFSLHSPILPWSSSSCLLELAVYSKGTTLRGLSAEMRYVDTNQSIAIHLQEGHEQDAWVKWKVLIGSIGKMERPFEIMLLYSGCREKSAGILALGSLHLRNCFHDKEGLHLAKYDDGAIVPCPHRSCVSQLQVCEFSTDCSPEDSESFCDTLPAGAHCSFEEGPCGWTLDSEAYFSWSVGGFSKMHEELLRGSALHTTEVIMLFKTSFPGHYLYLHIDSNHTGGVAKAYSANLPASLANAVYQVQFSAYIFGNYNGTISLIVQEETGEISAPPLVPLVWERGESWSDQWFLITFEMPRLQNSFHLQLVATWGWNSQADIAVDNITFGLDCFSNGRRQSHPDENQHYLLDTDVLDERLFNPLEETLALGEAPVIQWWFSSCGASGPRGPTQAQCDNTYYNTNVSVTVEKEGLLRGVQVWKVPESNQYTISAYGAAGGKGAKNHNKRSHGVFISASFQLEKDELLYILVGQQGEDACPGVNSQTTQICLGESSEIEEEYKKERGLTEWAGGGGGGGGATYIFRKKDGAFEPLLIAAGGGGKAYMKYQDGSLDDVFLEQYVNSTAVPGVNGKTGAAGGGGGWEDITLFPWAGKSLLEGGEGGEACQKALVKLQWATSGGFGGGGGACTSGGGGGGYKGGHASETDDITANGQHGVSFVNPVGEVFLSPLAVIENHGEVVIEVYVNCNHCQSGICKQSPDSHLPICICGVGAVLASDNVSCTVLRGPILEGRLPLPLLLAVVAVVVVLGMALTCGSLSFVYHRKKQQLEGARARLQSPEYNLSKIRTSTIMTDYNPNYSFAGKAATLSELKEIPRKNISLLRALGHGAFGEVYKGTVVGITADHNPLQVAIKTLPEICSEQDEMDFLMEALIISKFNHQNIVQCIGVSLQTLPRFILLELMTGGDMKSFLRQNRPRVNQPSTLTMQDLLNIARDIACGCKYLEENHFIHRDIAARNCLLTCTGPGRVAKIGDFGMARDIYRASYYRKGGRAMLPVKWMPPEAFLEGIFTSKTDTWSFGVLLWEIFSLGYMPYPCKTNQEVLEFVTSGGRMDPPKNCPGPVYRIMTQCWQHSPEYRPNFSTILERIKYCTQDPDVINTELPIECSPTPDDEGSTVLHPNSSTGMVPLLGIPTCAPQMNPRTLEDHNSGNKYGQCPQELLVENLGNWTGRGPGLPGLSDSSNVAWAESTLNQKLDSANTNQPTQMLKNKTKNLWNPTYGSWVLESICQPSSKLNPTQEREDSGFDGNCSSSPSSRASPSSPSQSHSPHIDIGGIELVKLQNFPCGNVNYAYDDLCFETNRPSSLAAESAMVLRSASLHREDKLFSKPEKTSRERDSGLSLSDDLSVTPV